MLSMSGALFSASFCPVALKDTHTQPYPGPLHYIHILQCFLLACLSGNGFGDSNIFPQTSLYSQVNNEWREMRVWAVVVGEELVLNS